MVLLNRYVRDGAWRKAIDLGGCDVVADAHDHQGDASSFNFHVAVYFEVRSISIQIDNKFVCYEYGFQRAYIDLDTVGCEIDVTSQSSEIASRVFRIDIHDGEASKQNRHANFSISGAIKGIVPWIRVGADAGLDGNIEKSKSSTQSESAEFRAYNLRPIAEQRWELAGWEDPRGLLHGLTCSPGKSLCTIREVAAERRVAVKIIARLFDLSVTRRDPDEKSNKVLSDINRVAVVTALSAKAFRLAERRISQPDGSVDDLTQTLTLAQARIVSVAEGEESDE